MTGFAKSADILITFPAFIPTDSRDEFTILAGTGRTWPTILAFHERLLNTSTTRRGTKGPVVPVPDHTLIPTDTRDEFTILVGTRGTRTTVLALKHGLLNARAGLGVAHRSNTLEPRLTRFVT